MYVMKPACCATRARTHLGLLPSLRGKCMAMQRLLSKSSMAKCCSCVAGEASWMTQQKS